MSKNAYLSAVMEKWIWFSTFLSWRQGVLYIK